MTGVQTCALPISSRDGSGGSALHGSLRILLLRAPSPTPVGRWPQNQAVCHTDPHAGGARLPGRGPRCRVGGLPGDRGLGSPWDPHFGTPGLGMQGFVMGFGRAWGPVATGWEGQGPSPAGHILRISCLFPAPDKSACNETTVIPVINPTSGEIPKAQLLSVTNPAAVLETHSDKGCPWATGTWPHSTLGAGLCGPEAVLQGWTRPDG